MKNTTCIVVLLFTIISCEQKDKNNSLSENHIDKHETIDYSKIATVFEPATESLFSEQAFYHLLLFGEHAKIPMWVVLDKSSADKTKYDIAYIDRDFDGVVGETGEKMKTIDKDFYYEFEMEDWEHPTEHKKYKIKASEYTTSEKKIPALKMRIPIEGEVTYCTMISKSNPKEASKLWVGYEKTLYSMDYSVGKHRLFRGDGNVTSYPYPTQFHRYHNTFGYDGTNGSYWYVGMTCIPEGECIEATLFYKDNNGVEKESVNKLTHRCCYYNYYGDVIVPDDAAAGAATLKIDLQPNTKAPFKLQPNIVDVTINAGEAYPDEKLEREWRKKGWDPNDSKGENQKRFKEYFGKIYNRFKSGTEEVTYEIMPSVGFNKNLTPEEAYVGFKPGSEIRLSIKATIKKRYYTYGIEEGDGYVNTEMKWTLPEGFEMTSLKWPKPTMKKEGDYILPIYEKEIFFNAVIQTSKELTKGEKYKLFARTTFQYCDGETCSLGEANNTIELTAE